MKRHIEIQSIERKKEIEREKDEVKELKQMNDAGEEEQEKWNKNTKELKKFRIQIYGRILLWHGHDVTIIILYICVSMCTLDDMQTDKVAQNERPKQNTTTKK